MVKHTQTIRRQSADELSVFDHFVKLALKGLTQGEFFWGFSDNIWQIAVIWIYFGILTWSIF